MRFNVAMCVLFETRFHNVNSFLDSYRLKDWMINYKVVFFCYLLPICHWYSNVCCILPLMHACFHFLYFHYCLYQYRFTSPSLIGVVTLISLGCYFSLTYPSILTHVHTSGQAHTHASICVLIYFEFRNWLLTTSFTRASSILYYFVLCPQQLQEHLAHSAILFKFKYILPIFNR